MTALRRVPGGWRRLAGQAAVGVMSFVILAACGVPFGIGQPTTRALERGAADSLDATRSFRVTGTYSESGTQWMVDVELVRPSTLHLSLQGGSADLEAIITADGAYFRGADFLSSHMGSDPLSRALVQATGNGWWKGSTSYAPQLPDFTDGKKFASTFMGPAATTRTDSVSVGGSAAIELSGPRADVFIGEAPPYRLLRVHLKGGAVIDGISNADFHYGDFGSDFGVVTPSGAFNFADLSTLPPIYTVLSVDTAGCGSPCLVAASLKNLGGRHGTQSPSRITFTMTDPQTKNMLGSCSTEVQTDVEHNATTSASCSITGVSGADHNAAVVTAVADNPGAA